MDGHFEAVQSLDDAVEELEDDLFDDAGLIAAAAIMIVSGVTLYVVFRRRDWL